MSTLEAQLIDALMRDPSIEPDESWPDFTTEQFYERLIHTGADDKGKLARHVVNADQLLMLLASVGETGAMFKFARGLVPAVETLWGEYHFVLEGDEPGARLVVDQVL